jgi:hypothetical protein
MSAGKKGKSTLAGEKRTADAAAEDSGRQTADDRRRMFENLAFNAQDERVISESPATCNLQPATCTLQTSPTPHPALPALFPTETEIYILPDGQVLFADLPAELADLAAQLGSVQPCAVERDSDLGSGTGDRGSC